MVQYIEQVLPLEKTTVNKQYKHLQNELLDKGIRKR